MANEESQAVAEPSDWQRTSPLAIVFFFGRILEQITKNLTQTLAPLAAVVLAWPGTLLTKIIVASTLFLVTTTTLALLRYWYFTFRISADAVAIRDGVLKKTLLDIKFDRIQAVNTEQNIVFRFFNLLNVKFDTAGSAQQEGVLPAVTKDFAEDLRARLQFESNARKSMQMPAAGAADDPARDAAAAEPWHTVLRLSVSEVLKVGLASNRALILLAFLAPLSERIVEYVGDRFGENAVLGAVGIAARTGISEGLVIAIAVVAGVWLFLRVISMIGALWRFYGFELATDQDALRSVGGLLTRHEHSIRFNKIQILRMSQGLMFRWFGRFELRARQAASATQGAGKCLTIPSATAPQLEELAPLLFRGEFPGLVLDPISERFEPISRLYFRARLMAAGVFPALTAFVVLLPANGLAASWVLLWMPLAALFLWRRFRRYGVQISPDGLAMRYGFISYRVGAFLFRKVQRISITQSPFQRRKGVANVRFNLASGSVFVPYMDLTTAQALRNHVLYRVESSELAWH